MAQTPSNDGTFVSRRRFVQTSAGAGIVAVAGCLGGDDDDGNGDGGNGNGGNGGNGSSGDDDLSGTISASGSNTVRPLTDAVGEAFEDENPDVVVEVRGPGTGAGFQEFTQGDTDIQNASRDIQEDEADRADDSGIEYTRFTVGQDALTVYLHPDNDWVDYLTVDELEAIYEYQSDVETWSDVRSEWPDEPIDVWSRDTDSGTFDYFTEALTGEAGNIRQDNITMRQETIAIVDGVSQNEYAMGFGGHSYWLENQDTVQAAAIQDRGEDEAYEPLDEHINAGDYTPLTRPLFTFYNNESFDRDEVVAFARFYFDNVQDIAPEAGFFGAPTDVLEENHEKLDDLL